MMGIPDPRRVLGPGGRAISSKTDPRPKMGPIKLRANDRVPLRGPRNEVCDHPAKEMNVEEIVNILDRILCLELTTEARLSILFDCIGHKSRVGLNEVKRRVKVQVRFAFLLLFYFGNKTCNFEVPKFFFCYFYTTQKRK